MEDFIDLHHSSNHYRFIPIDKITMTRFLRSIFAMGSGSFLLLQIIQAQPIENKLFFNIENGFDNIIDYQTSTNSFSLNSKSLRMQIGYRFNNDLIEASIFSNNYEGCSESKISNIYTNCQLVEKKFDLNWYSNKKILSYELQLSLPITKKNIPIDGGIGINIHPFNELVELSYFWKRSRKVTDIKIKYDSFHMEAQDIYPIVVTMYKYSVNPFASLKISIQYLKELQNVNANSDKYSVHNKSSKTELSSMAEINISSTRKLRLAWEEEKRFSPVLMLENSQSFMDLNYSNYYEKKIRAEFRNETEKGISKIKYEYSLLNFTGVGHIESWPFVDFVSSIFLNRLNLRIDGNVEIHSMQINGKIPIFDILVDPLIGYHFLTTDFKVNHWEPLFFVFGVKNYSSDQLPVHKLHLITIGFDIESEIFNCGFKIKINQILPISIQYWNVNNSNQNKSTATSNVSEDSKRISGGTNIIFSIFSK